MCIVHSKTLQLHNHNNRLSYHMTYLLIITLAPTPIPSHIPHIPIDRISLGVMQFNVMPRTTDLINEKRMSKCNLHVEKMAW